MTARHIFKIIVAIVFAAVGFHSESLLWAAQQDLTKADWSVTSPTNLAVNPPTDDMGSAVLALVRKLDPELAQDYPDLCPFNAWEFADLHRSGTFSLVVALSDGRFCGQNLIIDKRASGFREYPSSPLSSRFSGPQVEDLSGKGDFVVIGYTDFTPFNAMNTHPCIADFPVIYRWTGDGYADVSNQYKQYYQQQLASLKAQIDAAKAPPAATSSMQVGEPRVIRQSGSWGQSTGASDGAAQSFSEAKVIRESQPPTPVHKVASANACTKAEVAKIERFLGIDKDAGMEDAVKWAGSSDPDERIFGIAVLKDIGTPSAVDHLRTFSNDTSGLVAKHAKGALQSLGRPSAPDTIDW